MSTTIDRGLRGVSHLHGRTTAMPRGRQLCAPVNSLHPVKLVTTTTRPTTAPAVGVPTVQAVYESADLRPQPRRPGADDNEQWPSRLGSKRFYRDGRVEAVPQQGGRHAG